MTSQLIICVSILLFFAILAFNRQRIRYWVELLHERGWKSTVHYDRCLTTFKNLYTDVDAMEVSIQERKEKELTGADYTYGEVTFYSFVRILEKADPKPGEIFYDLGSGSGKAVFIAAMVFDFSKAYGIEKLDGLYTLSSRLLEQLKELPERKTLLSHKEINVEFIHNDFLSVDVSDADILFVSATCFRGELFNLLIKKLLELKVGARIILGTANLDNMGGFELKYSNLHLMSWGLNYIRIYERI